jgi:probable HAF family extracellular repeat protein
MKSKILTCITAMTLFAVLAMPVRLAAQAQQEGAKEQRLYRVIDLGTLGGTFSDALGINNRGWVVGAANLTGDQAQHLFLWREGRKTDLGTLGGPNSGTFGTGGPSENGEVVGWAETSTPDPLGENACGNSLVCLPFIWQNGVMTPLPTLGGNNGFASDVNNRGQAVGLAENTTLDSTCPPGFQFLIQTPPALWEKGKVQELPTVSGDPDGFVATINERGQAVGSSGTCTTALHALLWHNGGVTELGSLGGTVNFANDINNHGQVVGASDVPSDIAQHAFLWQNGAMTDLSTLPGDFGSVATSINDKRQVVGSSFGAGPRAFLWTNGVMTDLNTLVPGPPFSPLYLLGANYMNARGEIVGIGLAITGELHAFLALPCDQDHGGSERCEDEANVTAAVDPDQPAPVRGSPLSVTRSNAALRGRFGGMLDRLGTRQLPGHHLPSPLAGSKR